MTFVSLGNMSVYPLGTELTEKAITRILRMIRDADSSKISLIEAGLTDEVSLDQICLFFKRLALSAPQSF